MTKAARWARRARKFITSVVGAGLAFGAVVVASPSDAITAPEWLVLAGGLATACGVYGVPNDR